MNKHNIGSSILPSNAPHILQPTPFNGQTLLVVPDYDADTHHLTLDGKTIASHPNGHSCHALGERMIKGDLKRIQEQAEYIVQCGGSNEDGHDERCSVLKARAALAQANGREAVKV